MRARKKKVSIDKVRVFLEEAELVTGGWCLDHVFSGSWPVTLRIEMGAKMCKSSKETVRREVIVQVRDGNSIKSYPRMKVLQDPN